MGDNETRGYLGRGIRVVGRGARGVVYAGIESFMSLSNQAAWDRRREMEELVRNDASLSKLVNEGAMLTKGPN